MYKPRKTDLYPLIRRVLFCCKCLLSVPYRVDSGRDLVINAWLYAAQLTLFGVLTSLGIHWKMELTGRFSLRNPYVTLGLMRHWASFLLWVLYCFETKRQDRAMKRIFLRVKAIDDVVRITRQQWRDFARKACRWILFAVVTPLLFFGMNLNSLPGTGLNQFLAVTFTTIAFVQPVASDITLWMLLTLCSYYADYTNEELRKSNGKPATTDRTIRVASWRQSGPKEAREERRLVKLRGLYRDVDDLKTDVNNLFGNRIWACVVVIVIESVYLFFTVITIINGWGTISTRYSPVGVCLDLFIANFWLLVRACGLIELVNASERYAERGRETAIIVHELFAATVEEGPRNELAIFSLELLHVKSEINANGLFTVDYSLLPSVASAVVMHTLVLLQFDFPEYGDGINPFEDLIHLPRASL